MLRHLVCGMFVLLVACYSRLADAEDCNLEELGNVGTSCWAAKRNLARLDACKSLTGKGDPATTRTRLRAVISRYCPPPPPPKPIDKCANGRRRFEQLGVASPTDCLEKFQDVGALEALRSCPNPPKDLAERLTSLKNAVAVCSCKEDPSKFPRPSNCEEAGTTRKRAALRTQCPSEDASKTQAALKRSQRLENEVCSGLLAAFQDARRDLDAINDDITKNCRQPKDDEACSEKRQIQLSRLALYLEFFATTVIPTDDDFAHAMYLLAHVGLPRDAVTSVGDCQIDGHPCTPEEIVAASKLLQVLGSKERRAEFMKKIDDPKIRKNFEELSALQAQGANPVRISLYLNSIPPEESRALLEATSGLVETPLDFEAWKKLNEKELRRVELVVGGPDETQTCPLVQKVVAATLGGSPMREPSRVPSENYDKALDGLAEQRRGRCKVGAPTQEQGEPQSDKSPLGCGPIIGLLAKPAANGRMQVRAEVRWVTPGDVRQAPIPSSEIGTSDDEQSREAERVIRGIRLSYDRLRQDPVIDRDTEGTLQRCGMEFQDVGDPIPPAPRGLGIAVDAKLEALGQKQRKWFEAGLTRRLQLKRRWIGPLNAPRGAPLVIGATSAAGKYRLSLDLHRPNEPKGRSIRALSVVVDEKQECTDPLVKEKEGRWTTAGETAAERIIDYYRSVEVEVPVANDNVSRFLLPGAAWWDSDNGYKAAGGIAWSVGDVALLGSGVLLVGLSIKERNDYAKGEGSLDHASNLQYVGFGLLAGFVVERILWAFVGTEGNKQ